MIWWAAGGGESGWGINFAHQQNAIFATFYIFGPSGDPVWYTALLAQGAGETFSGAVYAARGTWFGAPWTTPPPATDVGTATFTAISPSRGNFSYRIGTTNVVKTIERYTFYAASIDGTYMGAIGASYTGTCDPSTLPFAETRQIVVAQSGNPGTVTIDFNDSSPPFALLCRIQGTGSPFGRLIAVPNALYTCTGFPTIAVNVQSIRPLDDGIEIHWDANDSGCVEHGRAAAVKQ